MRKHFSLTRLLQITRVDASTQKRQLSRDYPVEDIVERWPARTYSRVTARRRSPN